MWLSYVGFFPFPLPSVPRSAHRHVIAKVRKKEVNSVVRRPVTATSLQTDTVVNPDARLLLKRVRPTDGL